MSWIVIPGWERYQRDSTTSWIKVYLELEHRDEWLHLTLAERGLLVCIWLEYATRRAQLRTSDLPSFVLQKVPRRSLDSLQQAGFIEVTAEKPSRARAPAPARREEKRREEPPKPPAERGARKSKERKTGFRFVRGSHSGTYVPDPDGTDTPPYPVPKETR